MYSRYSPKSRALQHKRPATTVTETAHPKRQLAVDLPKLAVEDAGADADEAEDEAVARA